MFEPCPEPIPDDELAAILAAAILDGRDGRMTRDAEGYLAGVCAEYLVDRLALAGVLAVRKVSWIEGGDDGAVAGAGAFNSVCRGGRAAAMSDMDDNLSPQGNRDG